MYGNHPRQKDLGPFMTWLSDYGLLYLQSMGNDCMHYPAHEFLGKYICIKRFSLYTRSNIASAGKRIVGVGYMATVVFVDGHNMKIDCVWSKIYGYPSLNSLFSMACINDFPFSSSEYSRTGKTLRQKDCLLLAAV